MILELLKLKQQMALLKLKSSEIDGFVSLGLSKEKIQVYDFLAHGVFSDYNGLLGLGFLEGVKFVSILKKTPLHCPNLELYHFSTSIKTLCTFKKHY
jgi:hypothetical protein